ncbi:MAG: helix-turn-helix domain-containing protein [Dehalococcoidia bacterium]
MDGASIRKRVETLGPRKRGVRWPESLRREIVEYARRRRSEGIKVSHIARETGVSKESVRRWALRKGADLGTFVPVRVRSEATESNGIVIHTAQGHRVTGFDVEGAARFLRVLG